MTTTRGVCLTIALLLAVTSPAAAQPATLVGPDFSLTVGARVALTTGDTKWSFADPTGFPNVASELRWRGMDAVVPELNAELVWNRVVALAAVGGGKINQGVLIDNDFLAGNRQARFSHSRSDVDGDGLVYVNTDVGFRLFTWGDRRTPLFGYLDVFVGYQFWRERYTANGITGALDFPPEEFVGVPNSVRVIEEEFRWHSLRVGARTQVPIYGGLGVKAAAVVLPWTRSELDDTHLLREDLRQDPSFSARANGGFGFQLDVSLAYNVWRTLSVEAGYQYWRLDSGKGDAFAHFVDGTVRSRLNEIIIERYGPHVGVTYRFF